MDPTYCSLDLLKLPVYLKHMAGSGEILATFSAPDAQLCEVKLSHNATKIRGEWYFLEGEPLKVSCFVAGPGTMKLTQGGLLRKEIRVSSTYGK